MPPKEEEVRAAQRKLDDALERYHGLPSYPGEPEMERDMERRVRALDRAVEKTLAERAAGHFAQARRTFDEEVGPAVDLTRVTVMNDISLNSRYARELAERIQHSRAREVVIAFGLDAASLALAALALGLALKVQRRFELLARAHQALLERRAEELELFSGRVAHDILSPLQAVSLFIELATPATDEEPKLRRGRERAQASLGRVRKMVDDLLEFARAGAQPKADARVDASRVLSQLAVELRPEAEAGEVELLAHVAPGLEAACAEGVLTSLLQNLVRNAIKYIGEAPVRRIDVRASARGPGVRVEVEDSGSGLPTGLERSAFQPYVRGHGSERPGIGLGLATVKRLAESHGGQVGVISTPHGCLFWFELPGPGGAPTPSASASGAPAPPARG